MKYLKNDASFAIEKQSRMDEKTKSKREKYKSTFRIKILTSFPIEFLEKLFDEVKYYYNCVVRNRKLTMERQKGRNFFCNFNKEGIYRNVKEN